MQVSFTNHAWERCQKRGISTIRIQYRLKDVPRCEGEFRWRINGALVAVYAVKKKTTV